MPVAEHDRLARDVELGVQNRAVRLGDAKELGGAEGAPVKGNRSGGAIDVDVRNDGGAVPIGSSCHDEWPLHVQCPAAQFGPVRPGDCRSNGSSPQAKEHPACASAYSVLV